MSVTGAIQDGFIIGADARFLYKTHTGELVLTPSAIRESIKAEEVLRRHTEAALEAIEPDWFQ